MSTKATLSVIMPALNEEGNIKRAASEVLEAINKNFSDYEIIIFNDGSTDGTGRIADELANEDRKIKVIHNPRTMGLGYNYRRGVELAQSDYIAMFPADNEIERESIERMSELVGKADMIVPYIVNYSVRPLSRRLISRAFTAVMNFLFNLSLRYYNGTVIHKKEIVKSIPISTHGFAYQAAILTRLIKSGHSFLEVGMHLRKREYGVPKAFSVKNIISVLKTMFDLLIEIHISKRRKYARPTKKRVGQSQDLEGGF